MTKPTLNELTETFQSVMEGGEPQIRAGHCFPLDDYILLLRHLGYNADYENLHSEYGFIAQVRINDSQHALWEGGITQTDHSVRAVQRPLTEFAANEHGQSVDS